MGSRGASSGRLKNKGIHGNGIVAIRKTNNYKIGTNPNKLDAATQKGLKRIIRRRTNHERFLREAIKVLTIIFMNRKGIVNLDMLG